MSKCRICNGINEEIINFGKIALVGNFFKKSKKFKNIKYRSIFVKNVNMFKLEKF